MPSLRRSRSVSFGLQPAALPIRAGRRRWWPLGVLLGAGLLVLAWFDGGEEPLRPIAQPVDLPEQAQ